MILLFSRYASYKADFVRFFPKNPANYVSILMHEWKASSKRRESHFRGPRFQNFLGEYATEAPYKCEVQYIT
jgi:hypothetical protein